MKKSKKQNTRSSLLTGTSSAPTSRTWLLVSFSVTLRLTLMPYESCNVVLPSLWLFFSCFLFTPHHIWTKPVSTVKWPHYTRYQHLQTVLNLNQFADWLSYSEASKHWTETTAKTNSNPTVTSSVYQPVISLSQFTVNPHCSMMHPSISHSD